MNHPCCILTLSSLFENELLATRNQHLETPALQDRRVNEEAKAVMAHFLHLLKLTGLRLSSNSNSTWTDGRLVTRFCKDWLPTHINGVFRCMVLCGHKRSGMFMSNVSSGHASERTMMHDVGSSVGFSDRGLRCWWSERLWGMVLGIKKFSSIKSLTCSFRQKSVRGSCD